MRSYISPCHGLTHTFIVHVDHTYRVILYDVECPVSTCPKPQLCCVFRHINQGLCCTSDCFTKKYFYFSARHHLLLM